MSNSTSVSVRTVSCPLFACPLTMGDLPVQIDCKVENDPVNLFQLIRAAVEARPDWAARLAPRIILGLWHVSRVHGPTPDVSLAICIPPRPSCLTCLDMLSPCRSLKPAHTSSLIVTASPSCTKPLLHQTGPAFVRSVAMLAKPYAPGR